MTTSVSNYTIQLIDRALFSEKGGPGSGHHGHKGRKGKRGGSAPRKGLAMPHFERTVSGRQVTIKGKYANGAEVMAVGNVGEEKYLATPEEMHSYLQESGMFAGSNVKGVKFVTQVEERGRKFGGKYGRDGYVYVSTRDPWAPKKYARSPSSISRNIDHELAHHEFRTGGEKPRIVAELAPIMAKELKSHPNLGCKSQVGEMGSGIGALEEYYAHSTASYYHERGDLKKYVPLTAEFMEKEHG